MRVNDTNITKLKNVLTKSDIEERITVYMAFSMVAGVKIIDMVKSNELVGNPSIRIYIKELVYRLNELTIIDKTLLEKMIMNSYLFLAKESDIKTQSETVLNSEKFEDITLINTYFNQSDINIVNNNYLLYKSAYAAIYAAYIYTDMFNK